MGARPLRVALGGAAHDDDDVDYHQRVPAVARGRLPLSEAMRQKTPLQGNEEAEARYRGYQMVIGKVGDAIPTSHNFGRTGGQVAVQAVVLDELERPKV